MPGKSHNTKNQERILAQQTTELQKLKDSLPPDLLRAAEDKLMLSCLEIVEGHLDFAALGFTADGQIDEESIPLEWLQLPPEVKARKIRLARYGCMASRDIPHGAKMAHETLIGIIKARSKEKAGTKILNLEISTFPAPAPLEKKPDAIDAEFEVVDLE